LKCKELVIFKESMKRENYCMLLEKIIKKAKKNPLSKIILIKQKNSVIWYYYSPPPFLSYLKDEHSVPLKELYARM